MGQLRFGIFGATGRMGSAVIRLIEADFADAMTVVASAGSGKPQLREIESLDAIIDFSLPSAFPNLMEQIYAIRGKLPVVVSGTTGLTEDQLGELIKLGGATTVLHANNFSPGVAAMKSALSYLSPILAELGYEAAITETHHRHKADMPSGTALSLRQAMQGVWKTPVATHSIRVGEVIGRHDTDFYSAGERISLVHESLDRDLFARGAIDAAQWLCSRDAPCSFLTMDAYFTARFAL